MKQLQTIASFVQAHEAYVCVGKLRENGIDSFIKNELTTQTLSMISDQLGGVQLQVDLENVERATKILIDQGLIERPNTSTKPEDFLLVDFTSRIPILNKIPIQFQLVAGLMTVFTIIFLIVISFAVIEQNKPRKIDFFQEKQKLVNELSETDQLDPQMALKSIDDLLKIEKNDGDLYTLKSQVYIYLEEYNNAISALLVAKKHKKFFNINDYYFLATSYHENGDQESSINTADEALIKTKNYSDVGFIYELIGELEKANSCYAKHLKNWIDEDQFAYQKDDYKFMLDIMDSLSLEIKKNDEFKKNKN